METNSNTPVKNGIYNCDDFIAFLDAMWHRSSLQPWQNKKGVVNLMNDINLQGREIPRSGNFKAIFDGNNHTISGLEIIETERRTSKNIFEKLEKDGIIWNLKVIGSISARTGNSGIVGWNNGLILNCSFKGDRKGPGHLGGIAGYNDKSGIIIGCTYEGNISEGVGYCSGITGINDGIISMCRVNATIQSELYASLITGINNGKISMCSCTGSVVCKSSHHGGLAGSNSGEIMDCDCTCNFSINSTYAVGGITSFNNGKISGCTFSGETQTQRFGGIAGTNIKEITSCTCKKLIVKSSGENTQIGGIVSRNEVKASIYSCHSEVLTSSGKSPAGHIAYYSSGKILDCTWKGNENEKGVVKGEDTTIHIK